MGQMIVRYSMAGSSRTRDLELPIELSRREKQDVSGMEIHEVVIEDRVFVLANGSHRTRSDVTEQDKHDAS